MTIEEMNDVIQDHCGVCELCAIRPQCVSVTGDFEGHEDVCKEAYEIIVNLQKHKPDNVNHPSHYNQGKFECIDVMVETFGSEATQDFCVLNAFKYIWRSREKGGVSDLEKALWYLKKYLELEGASDDKA